MEMSMYPANWKLWNCLVVLHDSSTHELCRLANHKESIVEGVCRRVSKLASYGYPNCQGRHNEANSASGRLLGETFVFQGEHATEQI